jgi:carboxymethylenebutenolidase
MENKQTDFVQLPVSDGTSMQAYISYPDNFTTSSPGIIVLQEAFGVNHHIRNVADRFAKEGFVAIAPELFHRSAPKGYEGPYNNFAEVVPHYQALTPEGLEADLKAAYQWLTAQELNKERIFSVGYCLGGKVSFLANIVLPLSAAVSYYGGRTEEFASRAQEVHGRHLFFWGGLDKHITDEHIKTVTNALDAAGKEYVNVKISYADHAFNCDDRPAYNADASKEAWALTLAFLANN